MKKTIMLLITLLIPIQIAYAMEEGQEEIVQRETSAPLLKKVEPEAGRLEQMKRLLKKAPKNIQISAQKNLQKARTSVHNAVQNTEYAFGIKIINLSALYTLKVTGDALNNSILVEPITDDPIKGKQYNIKLLPITTGGSFTIEAFRPGSATIAHSMQLIRVPGKNVHAVNIVQMPNSTKFYGPIIIDDAYSLEEAKELYPALDL